MTKTKAKTMTITELSRVTGVSGASITALAKKWKLKPTKTGEYNRKYYSAKDCQRIIDYYQSKAKTGTKTTSLIGWPSFSIVEALYINYRPGWLPAGDTLESPVILR